MRGNRETYPKRGCIAHFEAAVLLRVLRGGRAFTLVEVLVVIVIISVLGSLLMPALISANSMAKKSTCYNNLREIGILISIYCGDNFMWLPIAHPRFAENYAYAKVSGFAYDLKDSIPGYPILRDTVFDCVELAPERYSYPLTKGINEYAWNSYFMGDKEGAPSYTQRKRLAFFKKPSANLCIAERYDGSGSQDQEWKYTQYNYTLGNFRHGTRSNLLFLDGHTDDRDWWDLYFPSYTYSANPEKARLWGHPDY